MSKLFCLQLIIWIVSPALSTETPNTSSLPVSCREVVYSRATNPIDCARVPRSVLGFKEDLDLDEEWETPFKVAGPPQQGAVYDTLLKMWVVNPTNLAGASSNPTSFDAHKPFDPQELPGSCRWDVYRSNYLGNEAACLCPATETTCAKDRKCWWYELPDDTNGLMPSYACLNNAERFYYLLEKLLKKRGKNDFAIKINYAGRPKLDNPFMPGGDMLSKIMMVNMFSQMMQPSVGSFLGGSNSYGYSNYNQGGYDYSQQPASNYYNYNQNDNYATTTSEVSNNQDNEQSQSYWNSYGQPQIYYNNYYNSY